MGGRCRSNRAQISAAAAALIVISSLIGCRDGTSGSKIQRYDPNSLRGRNLPEWTGTNGIVLSPDKAVLAAIERANSIHGTNLVWELRTVSLQRVGPELPWYYNVYLIERQEPFRSETIYVLLNGEIWQPYRVE